MVKAFYTVNFILKLVCACSYIWFSQRYHIGDPMTKHSIKPNGGAISMIDRWLNNRKIMGIREMSRACLEEARQTHHYVSKFPCEKVRYK